MLAPAMIRRLDEKVVARPAPGTVPEGVAALMDRKREVLMLLARGRPNAEIASTLFLSETTAKTHVTRILQSSRSATAFRP